MNANEEMLAGYADPDACYPDTDTDATWFEYRLCWYWCWFMYQNYVLVLYNSASFLGLISISSII